jgi:hypothetical protein
MVGLLIHQGSQAIVVSKSVESVESVSSVIQTKSELRYCVTLAYVVPSLISSTELDPAPLPP